MVDWRRGREVYSSPGLPSQGPRYVTVPSQWLIDIGHGSDVAQQWEAFSASIGRGPNVDLPGTSIEL